MPLNIHTYAYKNINPGFRKVQCETTAYEYPGLLVNLVNYEQCEM